jgi:SAM-dependent methyltransferase
MPVGSYAAVPPLVQGLLEQRPGSVLDLGIGFGGGGTLVREWLDQGVRPWKTMLVGVEAWPEYRNPVWELYNVIYAQPIERFLAVSQQRFDCVLLCDVLEHFEKAAGQRVLGAVQRQVAPGGRLIVTTPVRFFPQGAVNGNRRERHRALWTAEELAACGFRVQCIGRESDFCGQCTFAVWEA